MGKILFKKTGRHGPKIVFFFFFVCGVFKVLEVFQVLPPAMKTNMTFGRSSFQIRRYIHSDFLFHVFFFQPSSFFFWGVGGGMILKFSSSPPCRVDQWEWRISFDGRER